MSRLLVAIRNVIEIPYRFLFTHISISAILQNSKVDKKSAICMGVRFYSSSIGKYSYIGNNTIVMNTNIGSFSSIAGNCYIGGTSHPLDWVSTSSVFHKRRNVLHKNFSDFDYNPFKDTFIGNDVWIGEGCKIKSGVKISDGAVVGMGAIVTKDVGPYEIWAGNPARCIRKRFDDETIGKLTEIEWWNWNDERIKEYSRYFNNPSELIKRIKHIN